MIDNLTETRISRIEHTIYGNANEGLKVKVDRLEQARLSAKERWALYVGPLVSAVMVLLGQYLLGK